MRGLLAWLAIIAGVVGGSCIAPEVPEGVTRVGVLLGLACAWGLLLVGAVGRWWARSRARGRRALRSRWSACWAAAAVLLAVVRGATTHSGSGATWSEGVRGPAAGVRTLVVLEASKPTGRCALRVAPRGTGGGRGRALELSVPAELCPRAAGDEIVVLADALRVRTHASLPGAGAGRAGTTPRAFVDAAWLSPTHLRASSIAAGSTVERRGLMATASWAIARLRHAAWEASRGDEAAAFVVASALGLRHALRPQRRRELRAAGLGHVVAVSGLHVGIAAWLVARLLLRVGVFLRGTPWLGVVASTGFIAAYVMLAGAPPSAVRAGIMATMVGLGEALARPAHGMVVLASTSAVMLLARPAWAFDPGFQLSVVAMAVLVRSPAGAGLVRTTWRVTWAIVPVALLHFGRVGAYALVTNLVAVPLVTLWTLPLGLLGAFAAPWWGADALLPAAWGARAVLDLAHLVAQWPPVPAAVLAGVAGLSLVLSWAAGRRARGAAPEPRWVRAVRVVQVPPLAAVVSLVAIAAPSPQGDSAPELRWAAIGSPQRYAIVAAATRAGEVCVVDSVLAGAQWPGVLEALGVQRVVGVWPGPRSTHQTPHMRALEDSLRHAGLWSPGDAQRCSQPSRRAVANALAYCRRIGGPGRAVALTDAHGDAYCFARGRWLPHEIAEMSPHEVD